MMLLTTSLRLDPTMLSSLLNVARTPSITDCMMQANGALLAMLPLDTMTWPQGRQLMACKAEVTAEGACTAEIVDAE